MTVIFVDADACPVKEEIVRVAERHGLRVMMVSNAWMRLPDSLLVERVIVAEGPDMADDWIAERTTTADLVITADIPLAARCVKAGSLVLGPTGKAFSEDAIGMALAMRDLKKDLREAGIIREGGPSYSKTDRSRFLNVMETMVRAAKKISATAAKPEIPRSPGSTRP